MVFYTDKNGNSVKADHRRQIEASKVRSEKKMAGRKRRQLDKQITSSENDDVDYHSDNSKITKSCTIPKNFTWNGPSYK
jgi:hypothetical protein